MTYQLSTLANDLNITASIFCQYAPINIAFSGRQCAKHPRKGWYRWCQIRHICAFCFIMCKENFLTLVVPLAPKLFNMSPNYRTKPGKHQTTQRFTCRANKPTKIELLTGHYMHGKHLLTNGNTGFSHCHVLRIIFYVYVIWSGCFTRFGNLIFA